ncbi:MmcQ/YjbR family DNA-binding protein [Hyphomonas sp.]|uniref:MmcQ/YjbR family DNA-binding protein n=1 Tax=Hyphomonas sp. TaxID=87 RepID=UPI00391B979C
MITASALRAEALALPRAIERPHFDWASFRVDAPRGKIFATLPPHHEFSNVFLAPEEQRMLCEAEPAIFFPVPNKWGEKGATSIRLAACDLATLRSALVMSWRHAAPAKLHGELRQK